MNYDELKKAAELATPGPWIARLDGWTIRAYPDARLAADGIKVAHTCGPLIKGQGISIDVEQQVFNQQFIALSNPATILALLAEREKLLKVADECANHLYTVQDISRIKEMSKDALKELGK